MEQLQAEVGNMAFERLPGRQLQLPTEGHVAVKPVPAVFPTAAIVQQAIAGILKSIDPVERAKNQALIAYYGQLAANGGAKAMTPQQLATYQNTLLHNKALIDAQNKYKLPDEYFSAPQTSVNSAAAPVLVTPKAQPSGSLGGFADPRNLKVGDNLDYQPQASSGDLSGVSSDPNLYAMGSGVDDASAIEDKLKLSERERELLARGMI